MATIDQLDLTVYSNYAMRITLMEEINSQLRMKEAASIPYQLQMVDISPKLTEMDLVLGIVPQSTPWAYFYPPKQHRNVRRNTFGFFRVAPSFGALDKDDEEQEKLAHVYCENEEEEEEKKVLKNCLKQMTKINDMINYIVGRVGQFLQG